MIAVNGACELYYEVFGDPAAPLLVLVNGMGSQCINYPEPWCEMFAARGFRVVRMDNRDVGWSTCFCDAPVDAAGASYRLADMAADVIAVIDALRADRGHVLGASLGGMIAQTLAVEHPDRLITMTSVMSHTGEPGVGIGTPEALALLAAPAATDREGYVAEWAAGLRVWGSPAFVDEVRWRATAESAWDRNRCAGGGYRHYFAAQTSGDRAWALARVTTPTLVIHGEADTLIAPSGGRRTAELIPGARYLEVPGMGHDYPPELWATWVDAFADHAATRA